MSSLFPPQFDNAYRGKILALWLFALILVVKLLMAGGSVLNADSVSSGPDAIAIDTFSPQGQQAFLTIFKVLGWSLLFLPLLGLVALIRYRSMVPLIFLLLLIENSGRIVIARLFPIPHHEGSWVSPAINAALLAGMIIGFVLSLQTREPADASDPQYQA